MGLRSMLDSLEPHFLKGGKLEKMYPLYEAMIQVCIRLQA